MMIQLLRHLLKRIVRNPSAMLRVLVLLVAVLFYGTTGFLYFELPGNPDLSWGDGLWYSIVTMTTVGYGDFFPKTMGGRFLVGGPIMLIGIGLLGYALSLLAAALVTSKTLEVKGMSSFNLGEHVLVFNFPSLGKVTSVLDELAMDPAVGRHASVVVVDENLEELPSELQKRGIHFVRGNPTRDDTLGRAAVDRAHHAIVLSRVPGDPSSDLLSVSIVLAIEARSAKVNTVVECVDPAAEELLRKAGCDHVVCFSRFEAAFVSQELLNPGSQAVIEDLMSARGGQQLYLLAVPRESTFGEYAAECRRRGHLALGLATLHGIVLNPPETEPVQPGQRLVTIGPSRLELA